MAKSAPLTLVLDASVIPSAAELGGRGGAVVVQQHFHIDAKGAILANELMAQMRRMSETHAQAAMVGGAALARNEIYDEQFAQIPV